MVAKKSVDPEKVKGERMENDADHMEVGEECSDSCSRDEILVRSIPRG